MNQNMELLLRLVADYKRFCSSDWAQRKEDEESDELSLEDLDYIAAAGPEWTEPQKTNSTPNKNVII